jgi:2-keto-4-pentenoate hydratase/2-oxohepta-3-ene-1,7-dioic acid hydratase in catechol pathway
MVRARRPGRRDGGADPAGAGPAAGADRAEEFFHTAGNFADHHEELQAVDWSHPVHKGIVFFQNVDAIIGPDDAIVYPEGLTKELDYELELAIIIGKAGKFFGPADEVPDAQALAMELRVNGQVRQRGNTAKMLISIPHLVAYHSAQGYSAGDILTTGTISGVAAVQPNPFEFYLQPGDSIEAEIEGVGVLRNHVVPRVAAHDTPHIPPTSTPRPVERQHHDREQFRVLCDANCSRS